MVSIEKEIQRLISILVNDQTPDGSWDYAFETGIITDAFTIILLRILEINDEELIQCLTERLMKKQEKDGSWKLFKDQSGEYPDSTIQAYNALLFSGYVTKTDPSMLKAQRFILDNGGIEQADTFTKILLAITGQYEWDSIFSIPIELILLPRKSPLSFYDFSVFGRANLAPILILQQKKFQHKMNFTPDLKHLMIGKNNANKHKRSFEWDSLISPLNVQLKKISGSPEQLKKKGLQTAEQYMVNRIEPDGTLLSYYSATFFMIFAFLASGYPRHHIYIVKAVQGIKSMACRIDGTIHMQYTTANVWNTTLISHSLQLAGVPYTNQIIVKANHYLSRKQHYQFGDWSLNNPNTLPGGWGFSNINTMNPDVDDTTASLRTLRTLVSENSMYQQAWKSGIQWVLAMQNKDGGWPAFEKGINKKWLSLVPIQGAEYLLLDPSSADLTGRTLEFLANYTHLSKDHPSMKKGMNWLRDHQREDGSWYGRWGICYIYGTWAALTGMAACGKSIDDPEIEKALHWLYAIQNKDGGWGESCKSDIERKYIPLGKSTLTHTAWAVNALTSISDAPTAAMKKGIHFLIQHGNDIDWTEQYPTGQGMAAGFYIHYHAYRYIWPLIALAQYKNKYE